MKKRIIWILVYLAILVGSSYGIETECPIYTGWNLLSYPFSDTTFIEALFPFATPPFYYYNNSTAGYETIAEVTNGIGFWILSPIETTVVISSEMPFAGGINTIPAGWTLWGVTDYPMPASGLDECPAVFPPVFGYNAFMRRYFSADTLFPGMGYWVFASSAESITIPSGWTAPSSWTDEHYMRRVDDDDIPLEIRTWYYEDAARLALIDVLVREPSLIEIPEELIDLYYNGLLYVYNATELVARDSVVDIFNIHTFGDPVMYQFIVSVESSADWADAWAEGERLTGYSPIDNLMEAYDIQLVSFSDWGTMRYGVLSTIKPYNIIALCYEFASIPGVRYAEPNGLAGDGNRLTGSIETEYISLTYSYGWGDCMAGCISRHYWEFHVYYDGEVEFDRSYGDVIDW
ncbi:hypothetical protein JXI42_02040 [bacterium]|nr:hypothetical protein [bacterium]